MTDFNETTGGMKVEFDTALIKRLDRAGPRYTSYPTADRFTPEFAYRDYLQTVTGAIVRGTLRPLSLYIHVPFCQSICYYCGCNKVVTRDRSKAATYLHYLKREIDMHGRLLAGVNTVEQLHFGGGTPTYLSDAQMDELMQHLHRWFSFAPDTEGEYSIEVDPRTVSRERIATLRRQGFNRISLGVQDFEPAVQEAVNRIQPEAETLDVIDAARQAGFRSISIDLIYGLPRQTLETIARTLDKVIDAGPDRIAVYNYAHLPHLFKPQRRIADHDLPAGDTKLAMLALCIERLTQAGYVYIGMDHFARPDDALSVAQRHGRLHRNFQGYSTHAESDLIACGVSAIGAVGATYSQNAKTLDEYYERIEQGELPIVRGLQLGTDDLLRRSVIQMLMCNFELSMSAIEQAYPITFASYFALEFVELQQLERDGLLTLDQEWITVTPKGRLLIRNICMVFDRYLRLPRKTTETLPVPAVSIQRYSRTI
ncbi:oxygen-independent coproporphyrinogen III oxidase [uncultured Oxalicibacterium sp.]|uniref:oxygen-independent coproporphyrinogen III oxidase n=1 Tax=uncultured Oxalicibacterium sp. TaxID=1168540 RepID=UPI0025F89FEF|nr:oxygen-independent coproporphyrinogen III oxidase [uncultured Oxalicibacterium sp.]